MREKQLLTILDVLYDTAIERNSWSNVLAALAEPVDGVTGHLLNWDKQSGLVPHFETFGVDASAMDTYASHWVLEDPRAKLMAAGVRQKLNAYVEVAVNTLGAYDLSWARNVPFVWLQLPAGWRAAAFCTLCNLSS